MTGVDLFAGLGGMTQGARDAGCRILWAANHWQAAVSWHGKNHREVQHSCQDLRQADWSEVPAHNVFLGSPSCQGYSRARGKDRPHHDAARSTAWAPVSCMEYHRPDFGIIENVPAFLDWELYPAWSLAMRSLGYSLAPHIFDAADFGVPQHRARVFIILTKSAHPISIPSPARAHVPVSSVIRWNAYNWSPVAGHCRNTLDRVAQGRREHGDRFVMPYYGSGSGETGRSIHRPLGTLTTRDRWAIVDGDRMRMFQPEECRQAMGFPSGYQLPSTRALAIHLLGNAVCPPVPAHIIAHL